jgi:hypothetical protein
VARTRDLEQPDERTVGRAKLPTRDRRRRRRRRRRAIAIVVLVALIPVGWSYARALLAPGSAPISARSVEWFKQHGGRGIVLWAEREWYGHHPPPLGGTPSGGIPVAAASPAAPTPAASPTKKVPDHLTAPADVRPFVSNPLPHEGVWQTVGKRVEGLPTVEVTYVRPDDLHTSLLTGVMWMDTKLLQTRLIAGTQVPGGASWSGSAEVGRSLYPELAATFNSGFLLPDSNGGFYLDGRTAAALQEGQASLVIYRNGSIDLGRWGTDVSMTPDVVAVRQNLQPIVNHGQPVQGLATDSFLKWGATLGNTALVWRSGIGVTSDGALLYVAGPGLSVQTLANVLARAGAVRAMELDINPEWTTAMYYTHTDASAAVPHKLLEPMQRSSNRYLVPDERDFFAMFIRRRYMSTG